MTRALSRLAKTDKALIKEAGELLSQAFYDDPSWVWICPDDEARRRIVWLVEPRLLRLHVPYGQCWVTTGSEDKRALAAAVWRPPSREPSTLTYVRYGFLRVPFAVGYRAFRRFLLAGDVMDDIRRESAPDPECWYLDTLGVSPDAQGQGLGSESLQKVLRDVVDPSGKLATLFTSNPVNLPFYERAGFGVEREERVGGEEGFTFWYMVRR